VDLAGQQTIGEILPAQAARAELAGKPALFFGDQVYTYAQLDAAAANAGARLRACAVGDGDAVALVLPNAAALVAYLFGVLGIGAVVVPLNPALLAHELLHMVQACGARAIVTTPDLAAQFERMRPGSPWLPRVIALDPARPLDCAGTAARGIAGGGADRTAFVIFTAGTTGRPKGVRLTHRNVLANTAQVAQRTALTPADRVLHIMPLFHVNGLMNNTILPLRAGASIVLRPRFDGGEFWSVVASMRPTYFTAVPTVFSRLMDAWDARAQTGSLRFVRSGAAPMTPALQRLVEERLGVPVVVSYGLSEATCTCTMNPPGWARRAGSVGTALADETVAALGPDGRPLPPRAVGEIAVKGPNVMAGYLNAPDATAQALRDGWLHTGDLGYVDEDGFVFLTDRQKDLIIRGGENISPREVEDALLAHPAVAEAAVVGAPDREWGEVVVAFVVPAVGLRPAVDQLQRSCRERLARFKVPHRIEVVPALPLTTVGKVDKARLREVATSPGPAGTDARGAA